MSEKRDQGDVLNRVLRRVANVRERQILGSKSFTDQVAAQTPGAVADAITAAGIPALATTAVSDAVTDADIPDVVDTAVAAADIPGAVAAEVGTADIPGAVAAEIEAELAASARAGFREVDGVPAEKTVDAVHADYHGNDAENNFPGAITDPDVYRNISVTFGATWDGGDVTIVGEDQFDNPVTEVITPGAGTTVFGSDIFKVVTGISKELVGDDGEGTNVASVGVGDKLGVITPTLGTFGFVMVDSVPEAVTLFPADSAFEPTTLPNGARVYVLLANL